MTLPILAVTMGDPAGIGPEIIVRSIPEVLSVCRPVLIGEPALLRKAVMSFAREHVSKFSRDIKLVTPNALSSINTIRPDGSLLSLTPSQRGEMQFYFIRLAVEMTQRKEVDAIVTAPISKDALAAAGYDFPGHTELLAHLTQTHPPVMMLQGPTLRVIPLTTHCALSEVPSLLTAELVEISVDIVAKGLTEYFGIEKPRIALCGLNPHAGEGGLFGREEIDVLVPAVHRLAQKGLDVRGPFPADTIFIRALKGEFDAVVTPTHDQALIPLKLLHFDEGVNVTLGLPIIRTSPDHGTALDIAWQGKASPTSMIAAIRTAVEMVENRGRSLPDGHTTKSLSFS